MRNPMIHADNRYREVLTRRTFLKSGVAAAGASALTTRTAAIAAVSGDDAAWFEATIPQLQNLMTSGKLTSRELTLGYLQRIAQLNPLLHAVIETNPNAVSEAAQLDNDRRAGRVRGPLHGIPVLLKDNIATDDNMQTTAGSLALLNSRVPSDAVVVARLRAGGAIVLGKANLSEWANFRGFAPFSGWSARGGFTRDPYVLQFDPCGSSSGSASAVAANLSAVAVGTETSGSILCPSGNNQVVGLKPTVGLVSQNGIIPLSHSHDTAGPIARTVTDAAIMLGVMQSPFGSVLGKTLPSDYTTFLRRGALRGSRIGIDYRYFTADYGADPDTNAVVQKAIDVMKTLGATIVTTDTGDLIAYFDNVLTVFLFEFKVQIAEYLSGLSHTQIRSLADLMAFNESHCREEMKYFGQEIFELAEATSGNLSDPEYLAARQNTILFSRTNGIDRALQENRLDAIVAPSYGGGSGPAAAAGYPSISVPAGVRPDGTPVGIWMSSGFLREGTLLAFAYDLEQELKARQPPKFLGSVPDLPADAGICQSLQKTRTATDLRNLRETMRRRHRLSCCSVGPK